MAHFCLTKLWSVKLFNMCTMIWRTWLRAHLRPHVRKCVEMKKTRKDRTSESAQQTTHSCSKISKICVLSVGVTTFLICSPAAPFISELVTRGEAQRICAAICVLTEITISWQLTDNTHLRAQVGSRACQKAKVTSKHTPAGLIFSVALRDAVLTEMGITML